MSKAKPATKPKLSAAALLEHCHSKRNAFAVTQLPADQFKIVIEMFTEHKNNPGKYSMRSIATVLTDAFGVKLTRNMLDGAYAEFKLGKLTKTA